MGGKMDQAKGRTKQAAGTLVGDKGLEREGKAQRAVGEVEEKTEDLAEGVKKVAKKAADKVKSAFKR